MIQPNAPVHCEAFTVAGVCRINTSVTAPHGGRNTEEINTPSLTGSGQVVSPGLRKPSIMHVLLLIMIFTRNNYNRTIFATTFLFFTVIYKTKCGVFHSYFVAKLNFILIFIVFFYVSFKKILF